MIAHIMYGLSAYLPYNNAHVYITIYIISNSYTQ